MGRKFTYLKAKEYVESFGYTLLSKEYTNCNTPLEMKCNNGHIFLMRFSKFKDRGDRCSECSGRKRKTLSFIRMVFEKEGYTLLSKEYINNKTKLDYICPNGHKYSMRWNDFNSGYRCPECAGVKKKTYEEIKVAFEERGYKLLSEKYVNSYTKLDYICSSGHKGSIIWDSFKQNHGCPECAGVKKRTIEEIRYIFKNEGYTILSEKYVNSVVKLDCICPNNHRFSINWGNFRSGYRCPECAGVKKKTYEEIKVAFEEESYVLLSEEYINSKTKLDCICPDKHKVSISWNDFRNGRRCAICSTGPVSKISQKWLDSLGIKIREYYIKDLGFRVDGFDPKTNTIYEFLGDYWHGNPEVFDLNGVNAHNKRSFGELFEDTNNRLRLLENAGYKVVYIWENNFRSK